MKEDNKEKLNYLKKYIDDNYNKILKKYKNIRSIGIAYKEVEGHKTDELCLRFSVEKKLSEDELKQNRIKPLPKYLEDTKTDIVERHYPIQFRLSNGVEPIRLQRVDTIQPGLSISNIGGTAGTIGLIVKSTNNNEPLALSNWHVLRGANGSNKNEIVQPGVADDGSPFTIENNIIGKLKKSSINKKVDCAVTKIENRACDPTIFKLNIKPTAILKSDDIELGMSVVKSGRTTGVTYGHVNSLFERESVNYGGNIGKKTIYFFEISNDDASNVILASDGDSGSCWLENQTQNVLGLHFASSEDGLTARSCFIDSVFDVLNIELYP